MKRAIILAFVSTSAIASTNYTQDARDLSAAALCGATNTSCQTGFKTGATVTAASKRLEAAYKAIRAAEVPPAPPPPAPVPAPTPAPPPVDPNVPTTGLAIIPSNFDVNSELVPAWGTGAIPDHQAYEGAFRFICSAGQLAYDDPIVYPGQPGKSHLHQFFGNLGANAFSDYASLRTTGLSSCMSPLNRSAYWIPAMLNDKNQVIRPDYVRIYYKRIKKTDPLCAKIGKQCVDLPRGLRFVFGYNMLNPSDKPTGSGYFDCSGTGAIPGHYANLVLAQAKCPVTASIQLVISAPDCWNGKDLDSPDHRSHVAHSAYIGQSYPQCPSTHPYVIPTFTLGASYSQTPGVQEPLHLSSDEMPGMTMTPGTTLHADWWGAWDPTVQSMWETNCLDDLRNASGGDLCNGKQMKMFAGFSWIANPRLVPVPPKP